MLGDARKIGESGRDFLDQVIDGELGGFPIERAHVVAPLLVPLRRLTDDMFELALEGLDVGLRLPTLRLRPGVEFVGRDDLAVLRGRQCEADRGAQQQDRLLPRLFAQRRESLELLLLERLVDRTTARLVVFALERGGGGDLEVFDELAHRLAEAGRAPRRHFDGDRPVRLGEIVDVDPVGRARPRSRVLGEHASDGLLHADAVRADDEEVEALLVDFRADADRLERARLPDQAVDRLQFRGRSEGEERRGRRRDTIDWRARPGARAGDHERVVHLPSLLVWRSVARTGAASLTGVKASAANRRRAAAKGPALPFPVRAPV